MSMAPKRPTFDIAADSPTRSHDSRLAMTVDQFAKAIARRLAQRETRIVLAESCTAGLVSATLARVPSISRWHCGSAVTYRERTKEDWLDVPHGKIERFTAVSESVARAMAVGVLRHTPEADISASVTGHLGPDAPKEQDGIIYVGFARREDGPINDLGARHYELGEKTRLRRQKEAVAVVLERVLELIS